MVREKDARTGTFCAAVRELCASVTARSGLAIARRAMRVALPSASTNELLSHIARLGDAQIACNSQLLSQNGYLIRTPQPLISQAHRDREGLGVVTRPPGHPGEGANCSRRRGPGGYLEERGRSTCSLRRRFCPR